MTATLWVDIDLVEEPLHLLRTVDMESPKFQGLVASMRRDGFWPSRPIEVTEDKTGASTVYVICAEGMHRLTAARVIGLAQVPVVILEKELTEGQRLERAIVAEATHVEARPVEFGKALSKLVELDENKGMTVVDLAKKVQREPGFVTRALNLAKLDERVGQLVDDGEIKLGNAQSLVLLQKAGGVLDDATIERAKHEDVDAFAADVEKRIQEIRKGPRPRKEPAARLRLLPDVKAELDRAKADPHAPAGYVEALAWTLRQDAVTAAAEGASPPRLGAEGEGPALRAEAEKLEAALKAKDLIVEEACEKLKELRDQVARLEVEVEEKDAEIRRLKRNRPAKKRAS